MRLLRLHSNVCHINSGSLLHPEQNKRKTGVRLTYGFAAMGNVERVLSRTRKQRRRWRSRRRSTVEEEKEKKIHRAVKRTAFTTVVKATLSDLSDYIDAAYCKAGLILPTIRRTLAATIRSDHESSLSHTCDIKSATIDFFASTSREVLMYVIPLMSLPHARVVENTSSNRFTIQYRKNTSREIIHRASRAYYVIMFSQMYKKGHGYYKGHYICRAIICLAKVSKNI